MIVNIGEWLECARRVFTSRYVRLLEDDIARTRDEVTRERAEIARLRGGPIPGDAQSIAHSEDRP